MRLEDVYKATNTTNKHSLSVFLTKNGYKISSAAIYKWNNKIPESGQLLILKALGIYPRLNNILKRYIVNAAYANEIARADDAEVAASAFSAEASEIAAKAANK